MVMDFGDLKAIVKPLIDRLDHSHLNEHLPNPTAENIAGAIACWVASCLPDGWTELQISVAETTTASASVEISAEDWQKLAKAIPDEWRWRGIQHETNAGT
jgi:6-pyruvoyl-tetrahydropterin synthase